MQRFSMYAWVAAIVVGLLAGAVTTARARRRAASEDRALVVAGAAGGEPPPDPEDVAAASGRSVAPVDISDVLAGSVVLAVLAVAAGVAGMAVFWVEGFGGIRVLYLAVVVGVPVASASVLAAAFAPWGPRPRRVRVGRATSVVLVLLLVLPAALGAYATFVEPDRLDLDLVAGPGLPPPRQGSAPLRVGVVSDLQFTEVGPHERRAVAMVMSQQPDVVLVAGDVIQGSGTERAAQLPAVRDLLAGLHAPGGVYLVQGDAEGPHFEDLVEGTGVQVLRNRTVSVTVADRAVTIGGVDRSYWEPAAELLVEALATAPGEGDVRLLLAHRPDVVSRIPSGGRVDLTVAGHTHGGQVDVPGIGPLVTMSDVPRRVAAGGLHEVDGQDIYVSPGVGLERGNAPRFRLNVVPSVAVVTLGG